MESPQKKKNPPVNKTNLQKSQSRLEEKRLKIVRTQRDQSLNVSAWWLLEEIHTVEMTSSDLVPLRLHSWRCAGRVESSPRRDKLRVCVCVGVTAQVKNFDSVRQDECFHSL